MMSVKTTHFFSQAPKDVQDDDLVSSLPMRKKAKLRTLTLIGSDDASVQQVCGGQVDGNLIDDFDVESLRVRPFSPLPSPLFPLACFFFGSRPIIGITASCLFFLF
mmetsp:Transcript_34042/g.87477  ORF Transcript_34042/g.87477 Transcript_34042/m.87477 type:complete len:106 (+) Transcript_34042:5938-6255(+)